MKKLFIFTLLLIAVDLLHAQDSGHFSIVGKVYGEEVRQVPPYDIITKPLINAHISFKELPKQGWLTDSTGCFRIEDLKNGAFHLKASYIGLNSCDTVITSYNEKETLCLLLPLWYDYMGEHQYSPELSQKNIKEGHPELVIVIPEDKEKEISNNPFFQKYGVHYVGYLEENGQLTSYLAVPNCILASYNKEVFDYLDSKYGKSWRHEAPKGIFGLDKTLDEPRDYAWLIKALSKSSNYPVKVQNCNKEVQNLPTPIHPRADVLMKGYSSCDKPVLMRDERLLIAQTNDRYLEVGVPVCYLNERGDTVIPFGKYKFCQTDTIRHIGFAYENRQNGKIVCLDNQGNKLFNVFNYDNGVDYVKEGLFRITDDNGLIGFADTLGNIIIKPQFKFAFPFENGTAKVTDKGGERKVLGSNGEYHYWDSNEWYYIDRRAQDIDFPISLSEIKKYESRVPIQRLLNVLITHTDAYKIRTRQLVYSPQTRKITLDVINVNAPTAEPEYHRMKHWKDGKWKTFPFIDNLGFAGVGRDLSKGDTLPEYINMSEFKYSLKPNKYQVHFYVFANIYTYCNLTDKNIQPIKDTEIKGAFNFRVLESDNDSIRILFENHTNLSVQPILLPSVGTDELYMAHPLARSGWRGEVDYMRSCALLKGGEAMLFTVPVSWNVNRISDANYREQFKSGRLSTGKYKIGLQLEIYMDTEFEVK